MRKLALLTVILLTVCLAGAFAELTGVGAPTASGSVSLIIGFDLDDSAFGFVNDSSITLSMPLLDGSAGADGMDDMYGMITIDAIGWSLDPDEGLYDADEDSDAYGDLDASISASLHIDPLVITLGQPDFAINNVDVADYAVDANADASSDTGGFSIGYVSDMVSVTVKIASENDYRGDTDDVAAGGYDDTMTTAFNNEVDDNDDAEDYTANVDMNMVFGADISLAPADGVTVDIGFMYDAENVGDDALMGVGANIGLAMAPLTVTIPVDFVSIGDKSGFEVNPIIGFDIMEGLNLAVDMLFGSYSEVVSADLEGTPGDIENSLFDLGVTVTDSGAFVDGLTWTLAFALADMMDYLGAEPADTAWDLDVDAAFDMGGLAPYVNFGLDEASSFDFGVGAVMSADFTGIDNTTITADFTNEGGDPAESGRVTLDVTVAF
jgi:hypothetical protein